MVPTDKGSATSLTNRAINNIALVKSWTTGKVGMLPVWKQSVLVLTLSIADSVDSLGPEQELRVQDL